MRFRKRLSISDEFRINIWHKPTGIGLETLAALYSTYEQVWLSTLQTYGKYETEVREPEHKIRISGTRNSAL